MTDTVTAVSVFEELRFVWELFAAELILLFPFAKAKSGIVKRILICGAVMGVSSQFYFAVLFLSGMVPDFLHEWVVVAWYMILVLMSLFASRYCFSLTFTDGLYIVISGYTAQHMVYVTVHEVLARGIWMGMTEWLSIYVIISVLFCSILYLMIYLLFNRSLSLCGGTIAAYSGKVTFSQIFVLAVLMVSTFTCQHIFESSEELRYYGALVDCLLCVLILANQYSMCKVTLDAKEKAILSQMQHDSARFYTISRELIETVNRKSHDMKHILNALERADGAEKKQFIEETRREIEEYRQIVQTENEDLNTILAEKAVSCRSRGIRLECTAGDIPEGFVRPQDLYVMLGNALDNAMESAMKLRDEKKRVITVDVDRRGAIISLQVNNYYEGELKMQEGLPVTSKNEKYDHGFGLKSIRLIAGKYGGDMSVQAEEGIFTLQVMIPVGKK